MINKTYRFILLKLAFSFCCCAGAFSNDVDSLKKLIASNIPDSVRVNALNTLSKAYFNDNPDTSIVIAASSKKIAETINYQTGLALALKNMGI
jgi:hypothetical protein